MTLMPTWGELAENQTTPRTIAQAISDAVDTHEADPNAHIGPGKALEEHRTAEIIDHLAESVVNDKLKKNARRYVAIVDPASDTDFDTIAAAVAYAMGEGGGDIYIQRGTHYVTAQVALDTTISLYGAGAGETFVEIANASDGHFLVAAEQDWTRRSMVLDGITFQNVAANYLFDSSIDVGFYPRYTVRDCEFLGGGYYFAYANEGSSYENTTFSCDAGGPIANYETNLFTNCRFEARNNAARGVFFSGNTQVRSCLFLAGGYTNHEWLLANGGAIIVDDCGFESCGDILLYAEPTGGQHAVPKVSGCWFQMHTAKKITISGQELIFTYNRVSGSTAAMVLSATSSRLSVVANRLSGLITNSGTSNLVNNNQTSQVF